MAAKRTRVTYAILGRCMFSVLEPENFLDSNDYWGSICAFPNPRICDHFIQ